MELEDALSAKFRTLIEGLMVATTAEIVKMFSKFLTETRMEISRSWKEIDSLKRQLEESELQKTEAIIQAQMLSELKREDDEVEVSRMVCQLDAEDADAVRSQVRVSSAIFFLFTLALFLRWERNAEIDPNQQLSVWIILCYSADDTMKCHFVH